jgi:hypothetical protein
MRCAEWKALDLLRHRCFLLTKVKDMMGIGILGSSYAAVVKLVSLLVGSAASPSRLGKRFIITVTRA